MGVSIENCKSFQYNQQTAGSQTTQVNTKINTVFFFNFQRLFFDKKKWKALNFFEILEQFVVYAFSIKINGFKKTEPIEKSDKTIKGLYTYTSAV